MQSPRKIRRNWANALVVLTPLSIRRLSIADTRFGPKRAVVDGGFTINRLILSASPPYRWRKGAYKCQFSKNRFPFRRGGVKRTSTLDAFDRSPVNSAFPTVETIIVAGVWRSRRNGDPDRVYPGRLALPRRIRAVVARRNFAAVSA